MSEAIPVNPEVLRWARETAGLDIDEVVLQFKRKRVTAETIASWERGEESPNYIQLERLAYEVYHRPLALFFFPEPPEEEPLERSFRTLPDAVIERLPLKVRLLVRKARVMQMNVSELHDGVNPAEHQIVSDLSFSASVTSEEMAKGVRHYLGVSLDAQVGWPDSVGALKAWRNALETHGVFVFKDAFRIDGYSGFCLYDDEFPIIYVNNSMPKSRQVFTLFHELAHLLFATGGVDRVDREYVRRLTGDAQRIEVLCNRFAGEFPREQSWSD